MDRLSAVEIITAIQNGSKSPVDVVRDALARAEAASGLGAIQQLFHEEAVEAATTLATSEDLSSLPLAGLPILIKDAVPVAGHPVREGSQATSAAPARADHDVVRRLRDAGAIIIGTTRVPELCVWGTTDSVYGTTRNPWNPHLSPGGSSGGSAAAVAAGIVPAAHGTDGMGSIRIPAANCGLFGIKPGSGVVPSPAGRGSWGGLSEHGPFATTVNDAALLLSIMAGDPALALVAEPTIPLRIAVAAGTPSFLTRLSSPWKRALEDAAEALRAAGHMVEVTRFPYPDNFLPLLGRWFAGAAEDAQGLDPSKLEPRTLRHVKLGMCARSKGWVKQRDKDQLAAATRAFFENHDVLLTPMLARTAPAAVEWHRRSWLRNMWSNLTYAPFAAYWNMLGWPAASVPVGIDQGSGTPTAVQLVTIPGGEAKLLGLSAQLERLRPWSRTAPGCSSSD